MMQAMTNEAVVHMITPGAPSIGDPTIVIVDTETGHVLQILEYIIFVKISYRLKDEWTIIPGSQIKVQEGYYTVRARPLITA